MTLNEYQSSAYSSYFGKSLPTREQLINNSLGLTGEAGEVVDQLKKELYLNRVISRDEILEELGDTLWHLAVLASVRGVTLQEIADYNVEKLKGRYPDAEWRVSELGCRG